MKTTGPLLSNRPAWVPYVVPIVVFIGLTSLESAMPKAAYGWLYCFKAIAVTALLVGFRRPWQDIRPQKKVLLPALVVGVTVFVEWILIDKWIPYPHLGDRVGFNPSTEIAVPLLRLCFTLIRFYGLVILVPIMEELFWRSFLLRYLSNADDFTQIPIGSFTWSAFGVVAIAFALAHPEWLVAAICAAAYALLLKHTKSIFACIVAHSITNLALGLYVILAQDWIYW